MSLENLINKDRPTKEVLCIKHNVAYTSTNYIDLLKLFKIEFEEIIDLIDQEINL